MSGRVRFSVGQIVSRVLEFAYESIIDRIARPVDFVDQRRCDDQHCQVQSGDDLFACPSEYSLSGGR